MHTLDLTGLRFGKLRALKPVRNGDGKCSWRCRCDCGAFKVVTTGQLRAGETPSCGCVSKERKHGFAHTPTWYSWKNMKRRCDISSDKDYYLYGGRGITYVKRWKEFKNFLTDMRPKPKGLTLDRKNNDGNYSKGNCRWATHIQQANNRRPRGSSSRFTVGV